MASSRNNVASKRLKTVKSNISDVMSKQNPITTTGNTMSSKIGNYEKRLSSIGVDTKAAKDTRNPLEKALNLKEDQNFLFDIFEILGRPQQALFGGIEAMQEGDSFLAGAKAGLTGEETTNFGDILRNAGVSDENLFINPITKEETSLADILGLAGDIFLDPIDIPIAGTGKSLLENAVSAGAKGIRKGANVADNLVTKALTKADNVNLQKLANAGEDVTNFVSKTDAYKGIKKAFSRTADYSSSIPDNLYTTITRSDNALDAANAFGKSYNNSLKKSVDNYANIIGRTSDDIGSDIQKLISSKYAPEETFSNFIKKAMTDKTNTFKGTKEQIDNIINQIDTFKKVNNITDDVLNPIIRNNGTTLKIMTKGDKASRKLGNLVGNNDLMKQLDNIKLIKETTKSADDLVDLARVQNLYNNDTTFKGLVDEAKTGYDAVNKMIKEATGESISFEDMLREGYVTNSLTDEGKKFLQELKSNNIGVSNKAKNVRTRDEILKGTTKTTSEKTYSNYAPQANREFSEDINKAINSRKAAIKKQKSYLTENKIKNVKDKLKEANINEKVAKENYTQNLAKLSKNKEKYTELTKMYNQKTDMVSDIVNDDIIKKAQNINDEKLVGSLLTKSEKYTNRANKVESLKAELSKLGLTSKQVESLENKLEKAYDSLNSSKVELLTQVEKISNGATEKYIKEANKLADKIYKNTSSYTQKAIKSSSKVESTLSKIKQLDISYNDVANQLRKQQANLQLELKTLMSKSAETIAKEDKAILEKIGSLQKDIDLLSSFEGKQLFSTNFFQGFGDFVDKTTTQAKALNAYSETLLHSGLNNDNVIKFITKGDTAKDTVGFIKLGADETSRLSNYLDTMKNFMPEDSKLIKTFKNQIENSKEIYIDKGLSELLKINVGQKELNPLMNMLNNYNNFFKKYSTLTPGFQLRNISGNAANMILSGVPAIRIPGLYKKANKLGNSKYIMELITKNGKGTLTAAEAADYKIIKQFIEGGFAGTGKEVRDLGEIFAKATTNNESKNLLKKSLDKVFEINVKGNEFVDSRNRMALLLYANKNPKYVTKLGARDAIDATKKVLFDPKNLSPFEQKYMKKIIPFYTFTKQNLIFQANNILTNTSKYNRLVKTFNKAYEAIGEENYRQYQKENFELPVSVGDGGLTTLKLNLPVSDLGEYLSNPLQRLVSSTSPLIKTPFELSSGVDTFTGQDISDRSGLETLARSLGLTNVYNAGGNLVNLATGETEMTPATIVPSIFRYSDAEKIANQREYEELMQYQQIVKDLKNQGIDVPTINELTNSTNATIKALKQKREKLQKRRS